MSAPEFVRNLVQRASDRLEAVQFANLADDVRMIVPPGYRVHVNTNKRQITISKEADRG